MPRVKIFLPEAEKGSLLLLGFEGISPSEMAEKLAEYGICVRAGLHCAPLAHTAIGTAEGGTVRSSPCLTHIFEKPRKASIRFLA